MKRTSHALFFLLLIFTLLSSLSMLAGSRSEEKREREREKKREAILKRERAARLARPTKTMQGGVTRDPRVGDNDEGDADTISLDEREPVELTMYKAASISTDLRRLPLSRPKLKERDEREFERALGSLSLPVIGESTLLTTPRVVANAPMPAPVANFLGLDFLTWGAGRPPDTVGDVGPNHYIQAVNTSIGIYAKTGGAPLAAFTFDTFMSQGDFGNLCDTDNFGDPVILYDTFEDRWVITDFAFQLDGGGNVVSPPGAYQCFAVSKTGDPVSGGWNFYSIHITDNLNDYPKLGIWPDGIYMGANMFGFPNGAAFVGTRVWAFNKAQMYAGEPTVKVVQINPPASEFTMLPANARLQTGTPPPGSPNYFATVGFTNAVTIYKFHVDWNSVASSTLTGPFQASAAAFTVGPATVPAMGGNANDTLASRLMMQNQYTNIGGVESVWDTITVRHPTTAGVAAPRWFQVNVTGGTVAAATVQAATHAPDTTNRYMGSLAVDRAGDMALGYSASSATLIPAIRYAGRLAGDAINTLPQTESSLVEGTGSQNTSTRWGDYSAMSLDPDGCTFWFTNEYYITTGSNWQTRVGSFAFPSCTPVTTGTLEGTVTVNPGGAPIVGATIRLGSRTATTDGSGFYQFTGLPAGTYPTLTAAQPGYVTGTATSIVINGGATTTQNFSLTASATSACITDTTQADFLTGTPTNVDVNTSPGDLTLLNAANPDQQNLSVTANGFGITATSWAGQTFLAGVTGNLTRVDLDMFCSGCTGTFPNLTVSIRATTGSPALPTGADLATATIPGFNSGSGGFFAADFATPLSIVAGTRYAIVVRPTANPSAGSYAYVCSCTANSNPYTNGQRVTSANSGGTWTADVTSGGRDLGFVVYVKTGFPTNGTYISTNRDSNALAGLTPVWSTLSWNATTPANTGLQFQVAGSNSPLGPFNFIGPDGTSGTFFTSSPAALTQFYNQRYLQYKAVLTSTDITATPTVNDVTACFNDTDCSGVSATITPTPTQVCPSSTGNTADGPAGMTSYQWSITNGTITGGATSQTVTFDAGASGNVGLTLKVVSPSGCQVTSSVNVPIGVPPTPTATPGGPTTFCAGGSVTITSSSATGNQWYDGVTLLAGETNQTYVATASGNYNVVVTASGCPSAPSSSVAVTVNPIPSTPTATPGGPTTFCAGGSVTLTSSSATGNQWYDGVTLLVGQTNQTYVATASGNYNVVVTTSGCPSAPSSSVAVTVNPAPPTPTATPGGPTTFCAGGSVTLTSSSATGNQWYDGVTLLAGETNQTYVATANGNYNVVVTTSGCPSAASNSIAVTANPIPATPTATPGGPTTFCAGGSVTLTSSSATGNQWYDGVTLLAGETNQTYVATGSGNYNVVVTTSGCPSAPSSSVAVTVNPAPPTPTATPGGPTTFCAGGSVTLTSSSATGNQWYDGVTLLAGQTNQTYVATANGNYNVVVTTSGCSSAPSSSVAVTVNPIPSTPTATPGGPTTFCAGGSVTLTSSSATGNQWYDGVTLLAGQTNQTYVATANGNYNVVVTTSGCPSAPSSSVAVTVNPAPPTPTITPSGPTTFCAGGSVTLTSSSATGNQWYDGVTLLAGQTNQTYVATANGNYNVVVTASGCPSAPSSSVAVTVNPIPSTPTATPGGPTTFCAGGSVTLTSSSATGNQWYDGVTLLAGQTNQTYVATANGNYNVVVTTSGCPSAPSSSVAVTVNPIPSTPTITPSGPTTFCAGGSVTLTSSSASGNQWLLNGSPIGGQTAQTLVINAAGDYSVHVTTSGCASNDSAVTTVTVNPNPNATITSPGSIGANTSGTASVPSAGAGATYAWSVTNGTLDSGQNTNSIGFTAGASGSVTLNVTVTGSTSCSTVATPASVTITVQPTVTITSVSPSSGTDLGGTPVTITGTSFASGASVTFGGNAATSVVVVNSTTITAITPAHAAGAVNVTVTNTDTTNGALNNGYTYVTQQFDANNDGVIDPADIFYLVNYIFGGGPAPAGPGGLMSGDANGDSVVDPADIFYVIHYLFLGGPAPLDVEEPVHGTSVSGTLSLGRPVVRAGRTFVPVSVSAGADSIAPRALSLELRVEGDANIVAIRRAGSLKDVQPTFEVMRPQRDGAAYLLAVSSREDALAGVVAEIEIAGAAGMRLTIDPMLTMLTDVAGRHQATVANGALHLGAPVTLDRGAKTTKERAQ